MSILDAYGYVSTATLLNNLISPCPELNKFLNTNLLYMMAV